MLHFATSFCIFDDLRPHDKPQGGIGLETQKANVLSCLSVGIEANASKLNHR